MLFEAPGEMTLAAQQRIWALAREAQAWPEVREAVPGMNNLMLTFVRTPRHLGALAARLRAAWDAAAPLPLEGRVVELPVVYGGAGGPHMADVVAHTGLSRGRDRRAAQRAGLPGLCARQPPGLLLPGRHGPAHRHAAAQGAGAQHSRAGRSRSAARRPASPPRTARAAGTRSAARRCASSIRRRIRRHCCSPATPSAFVSRR